MDLEDKPSDSEEVLQDKEDRRKARDYTIFVNTDERKLDDEEKKHLTGIHLCTFAMLANSSRRSKKAPKVHDADLFHGRREEDTQL